MFYSGLEIYPMDFVGLNESPMAEMNVTDSDLNAKYFQNTNIAFALQNLVVVENVNFVSASELN